MCLFLKNLNYLGLTIVIMIKQLFKQEIRTCILLEEDFQGYHR